MSLISDKFKQIKASGRKGLIVYVMAGYPDYTTTLQAIKAVEAAGADLIEIGLPFSDPMADGPIIQYAATRALSGGATVAKTLAMLSRLKQEIAIPLAVMTYYNLIMQYGIDKFIQNFSRAGVCGLIVPDLPLEEAGSVEAACRNAGVDLISLIAPTTTPDRLRTICRQAEGFLYCVSSTGVTGVRQVNYSHLAPALEKVRQETDIPVAIGFGIGSPEAACQAAQQADAVIIGSAVMERLKLQGVNAAKDFVAALRYALDKGAQK